MAESLSQSSSPVQSIRRSFTLPTKLNPQAQRGSAAPNLSGNVIYYHPSAKIVHFAPRALVPIPSSSVPSDFDYPVDTIETLPWRSATERTVATAPLRLERGLTVFLKCGNVVHAILKNSQCWCVDGVSKFVLRIRPLTYYRIEIPHETAEDKALVEDLKAALPTVLRYEVTPCPFKRAFTIELPEDAMAPRRKKAWKPKERKDSLRHIPESNQLFPFDAKSDWLDSASTGEDTDGAATDESGLIPQETNSTTSEAVPAVEQAPSPVNSFELPSHPSPIRRSVTESPQTFTSLLAKFDGTPVPAEAPTSERLVKEEEEEVEEEEEEDDEDEAPAVDEPMTAKYGPVVQEDEHPEKTSDPIETVDLQDSSTPEKPNDEDTSPSVESSKLAAVVQDESLDAQEPRGQAESPIPPKPLLLEDAPSTVPPEASQSPHEISHSKRKEAEPSFEDPLGSQRVPTPLEIVEMPISSENVALEEISMPKDPQVPEDSQLPDEESESKPEPDIDNNISFASTPESFHSATGTHSAHAAPTEIYDPAVKAGTSVAASVAELSAKQTSESAPSRNTLPGVDATCINHSPTKIEDDLPEAALKMPKYIVREDPPKKPSLSISSNRDCPVASPTSPTTDFQHMSTEFRRRAQATRRSDVSPIPSSSALCQPASNEHTSSLLSKALFLVLVPPIQLFIILLHVAARIVISPALNSTLGEFSSNSRSPKEPVTEDDFSFPLEREPSSEYEDAEMSKKLDPWDLD
ncbi:uncharacterized protein N7482_009575 [Penicillium canariense]|uniref:Inheritance of peroxisomes protein 1 n=1 Tax=Penicillium canariense TaxID=189055 RepID=A0A9W9LG77_9EURO|nr:uncharacterized protein N7482_009575 [Penicillium canariense]KAJ5153097.1 hypothetical protein N7482_009575 [Penicillium canariense]